MILIKGSGRNDTGRAKQADAAEEGARRGGKKHAQKSKDKVFYILHNAHGR